MLNSVLPLNTTGASLTAAVAAAARMPAAIARVWEKRVRISIYPHQNYRPCRGWRLPSVQGSLRMDSRRNPGTVEDNLKNNSFVTGSAGDLFPIQKFKQRNGVLAADAGKLLELRHGQ